MDNDLKNKTLPELEKLITDFDGKKYLAKYIFSFIHAKDALSLDDYLREHVELDAIVGRAKLFDLSVGTRLLFAKSIPICCACCQRRMA